MPSLARSDIRPQGAHGIAQTAAADEPGFLPQTARVTLPCQGEAAAFPVPCPDIEISEETPPTRQRRSWSKLSPNRDFKDLNVRAIAHNRHLARSIIDGGFDEFRRQLQYKARFYGAVVVVADSWFPSSKTRSCAWMRGQKLCDPWICENGSAAIVVICVFICVLICVLACCGHACEISKRPTPLHNTCKTVS
jgi:hypothetical protein